jgi:hypothetical protein
LRCASEVSTCQRWRDQFREVGHPVDRGIAPRRHEGHVAGPEARRAEVVAPLAEP